MNRKFALTVVGASLAAGALTLGTVPADAAAGSLHVIYDASGTTTIAKTNSSLALGPTTLDSTITSNGSIAGSLSIPSTATTFKAAGLIPVSATVSFLPSGQLTGKLKGTVVKASTAYTLRLSNVKLAGLPAFVGQSCTTVTPAQISVATPTGQKFNVLTGGTVSGTFTIPKFGNCGLTTGLINLLVPGPNNAVSFTLSNARLGS